MDRAANDSQIRWKFDPIGQILDPAILFNNRVEFPADTSVELTFYDAWEELPQHPIPASASDAIPAWVRQTAEARRNAAARTRPVSRSNPVPTVPAPTSAEGEVKGPPLVSEQIWDAVPDDLRAEARRYAALHYAAGELPDRAMVMGVEQARRTRALVVAVIVVRPEFDQAVVAKLADESRDLWKLATLEAVLALIAKMEAKQAMGAQRNTETSQFARKEFLRRVRLEAHSNSLFLAHREAIVAEAVRMIDEDKWLAGSDPYRVALAIWRAVEKARKG
ncbi:hypothetical protein IHV25_06105 [Phaeovibrio sulfidiphilus]|uniref:Uncharacterized protein n=1 Tax=Phaeovibrio sulfidiphilus TaxID=1220600 RepID=A0A8J7CCF5_9PROT|nr:hypothetical protein [Phaeovibrio sulfidiphilus]MBE1237218.1 hypothetical protein [Phaeovibrio sulfidiphilus]